MPPNLRWRHYAAAQNESKEGSVYNATAPRNDLGAEMKVLRRANRPQSLTGHGSRVAYFEPHISVYHHSGEPEPIQGPRPPSSVYYRLCGLKETQWSPSRPLRGQVRTGSDSTTINIGAPGGGVDVHQQQSVWSKMRSAIAQVTSLCGLFPPTIVQTPHGTASASGPASTRKRSHKRTMNGPERHPVSPFVAPPEDSFRTPEALTAFDGTQSSHALQRENQGTVQRQVSIETGLIEALFRLQGQPHFREIISTTNDWGQTLAHVSIFYGYPLLLSSLVDWRINLAIADVNGFTALHYAYMKEDLDSVRILRRGGASEVVMDKLGRTPLDLRPEGFGSFIHSLQGRGQV